MDRIKRSLQWLVLVIIFFMMTGVVLSQDEEFENLDWQLPFPEEILTDASAEMDISSGFYLSGVPEIGAFFGLNPKMHFLIFDGEFNIMIEQRQDEFGTYFHLANREISDYFNFTRVKYKHLIFNFRTDNRLNSKAVFLPRVDFNRKYVHFNYDNQQWKLDILSPEWSSWTFDFSSPALSYGNWGIGVNADAFLDNSSSITYAVSAGPAINYKEFKLYSFAGFQHFGIQNTSIETYDEVFDEGADHLVYGLTGEYEKDQFAFRGGVIQSTEIYPFFTVRIGPLQLSSGKALFPAYENPGRRAWTDVYWNFETGNIVSNLGFSVETDYNQQNSSSLFADFEFRVYENLFMDIRLVKKEDWLFKMGGRYNFKFDFYNEQND